MSLVVVLVNSKSIKRSFLGLQFQRKRVRLHQVSRFALSRTCVKPQVTGLLPSSRSHLVWRNFRLQVQQVWLREVTWARENHHTNSERPDGFRVVQPNFTHFRKVQKLESTWSLTSQSSHCSPKKLCFGNLHFANTVACHFGTVC